ncbi:MAG: ribosome silencing factor [Ruminococcaceae bacterium]|nr:ribosome silencing factor [Oscillospiraceae bacterium]
MNSEELMQKTVAVLSRRKTENIKVLNISSLTTIADYFVICNGNSSTQIKSLADELEEKLKEENIELYSKEGFSDASWILLDYSTVVVHIFNPEQRDFYSIESLWSDAPEVDVSDIIEQNSKM